MIRRLNNVGNIITVFSTQNNKIFDSIFEIKTAQHCLTIFPKPKVFGLRLNRSTNISLLINQNNLVDSKIFEEDIFFSCQTPTHTQGAYIKVNMSLLMNLVAF